MFLFFPIVLRNGKNVRELQKNMIFSEFFGIVKTIRVFQKNQELIKYFKKYSEVCKFVHNFLSCSLLQKIFRISKKFTVSKNDHFLQTFSPFFGWSSKFHYLFILLHNMFIILKNVPAFPNLFTTSKNVQDYKKCFKSSKIVQKYKLFLFFRFCSQMKQMFENWKNYRFLNF